MKVMQRVLAGLLSLVLLCGCQTDVPASVTDSTGGVETGEALAVNEALTLEESWEVRSAFTMGKADTVRILLCRENGEPLFSANVVKASRKVKLSVDMRKTDRWKNLVTGDPLSLDTSRPAELVVRHFEDRDSVWLYLYQDGEELGAFKVTDITERTLLLVDRAGVSSEANAVFSGFSVSVPVREPTPYETIMQQMNPGDEGFYLAIARAAVDDMLGNFWEGDLETGRIMPTSHGYATHSDYTCMWESAMLLYEIHDMWAITGEERYRQMLAAEANYVKGYYDAELLEVASGDQNWASDDCAWNAMLYLSFYDVTGDQWFLDRTVGLLDSVNERWYDEELNGIYYKDGVDYMSLYEVGIAWSWLRLWEITGEQRFYDLALRSYEGMHDRLGKDRDDGIYFIEATKFGPKGEPQNIGEAGSSSFLTGNMGMAALAAKFYRLTGEQEYLDRVYRINEGILKYYDNDGVLLNDRDAWTNGAYAAFYASEVLTLPGTEAMQELLKNTAISIVTNARTEDGYFGGSWSGPAEGEGSTWYMGGSKPQQSMTTGTSVLMVTAAAILEAGIRNYSR